MGALWEQQAMVAALITVPGAAVAAVTPGFTQFCMGMFFVLICGLASLAGGQPIGLPWLFKDEVRLLACATLLGTAGVAALAMQYRMRKTLGAAFMGGCAVVCTGAMYAWTPALYTERVGCALRGTLGQTLSLVWSAEQKPDPRAGNVWGADMYSAPVELKGTGAGQARYVRALDFTLLGPDGQRWTLGPGTTAFVENPGVGEERFRLLLRNRETRRLRGERGVNTRGVARGCCGCAARWGAGVGWAFAHGDSGGAVPCGAASRGWVLESRDVEGVL